MRCQRFVVAAVLAFGSLAQPSEGMTSEARFPIRRQAQPRIELSLDASEATAVLSILAARREGRPIDEASWQQLFATEPYQRLKKREAEIAKRFNEPSLVFTDADFRKFVLSKDLAKREPALRATLDAWQKTNLRQVAARGLAYLPASASIRAKVFPTIKPGINSFVYELSTDPTIFLYLDPSESGAKFENTVAHELHHIGLNSVESQYEQKTATLSERAKSVAEWLGSFGEGVAILAAAGSPDADPHAASTTADRSRWQRDLARFNADLVAIDAFFTDTLSGKLATADAEEKGASFYGSQGPWYTVGYRMAAMVEKRFGRERLVDTMLDPRELLVLYNQAASEENRSGKSRWPLWSKDVLKQVGALER